MLDKYYSFIGQRVIKDLVFKQLVIRIASTQFEAKNAFIYSFICNILINYLLFKLTA